MDLVGRFGAGAFLRLRHPAPLAPPPARVEDHHQAEDGEQQGNHPSLQAQTGAGISQGQASAIPWDTDTPGMFQGGQSKGTGEGSLITTSLLAPGAPSAGQGHPAGACLGLGQFRSRHPGMKKQCLKQSVFCFTLLPLKTEISLIPGKRSYRQLFLTHFQPVSVLSLPILGDFPRVSGRNCTTD